MPSLTLIIHIYYKGSWKLICSHIGHLLNDAQLIVSGCYRDVLDEVDHKNAVLLRVPNKGKDIGGKMAALDFYLKHGRRTDYLAFVHDKISPQTINAEYWLTELYSIFEPARLQKALKCLKEDPKCGVVGSKSFLKTEWDGKKEFSGSNRNLLLQLVERFDLQCTRYEFIAGTIFISRSIIFERFFNSHPPLLLREELEPGNVLDLTEGTVTHCWERLFCFIAENQGYRIKSI